MQGAPLIVKVFDSRALNAAGGATSLTSEPMPARGNRVYLAATCVTMNTGPCVLTIEGSYDGTTWVAVGTTGTLTAFGYLTPEPTVATLTTPMVRVKAVLTAGDVLFEASLAFAYM